MRRSIAIASVCAASTVDSDAHTEPYSFFNLAAAEFPSDWTSPTARVSSTDSPLDLALMAWFMRKIAMAIDTPMPSNISYDEFIALCFLQMQGRDPDGQRDITLGIMRSLMPPGGDKIFRKLFPTNKFSLELNAVICKIVFAWMVGPMTVESTTENDLGEMIASKVHIKKCRWLQESGCTGMCVNMCKTATQDFFVNDFGLPLTIKPNFEDKSCDFYFGLTPPPIEKDEALTFEELDLIFVLAKLTVVDETHTMRHRQLSFTDFCEALWRVAAMEGAARNSNMARSCESSGA